MGDKQLGLNWKPTGRMRGFNGDEPEFQAEQNGRLFRRVGEDIWIQLENCRWRLLSSTPTYKEERVRAPAMHDVTHFPDGTFRYSTHGRKDTGDQPCIVDYADEMGRKHWPDYVVLPDGRQGPRPFRSKEEERSYQRLTGIRETHVSEDRVPTTQELVEKAVEKRFGHILREFGER